MSFVRFDLNGFDEYAKGLEKFKTNLTKSCANVVDSVMDRHIKRTKSKTPVDTGNLRRRFFRTSVKIKPASISATMRNNTEYGVYVEKGHRIVKKGNTVGFVKGKFMMENSEYYAKQELKARLERIMYKSWWNQNI